MIDQFLPLDFVEIDSIPAHLRSNPFPKALSHGERVAKIFDF